MENIAIIEGFYSVLGCRFCWILLILALLHDILILEQSRSKAVDYHRRKEVMVCMLIN